MTSCFILKVLSVPCFAFPTSDFRLIFIVISSPRSMGEKNETVLRCSLSSAHFLHLSVFPPFFFVHLLITPVYFSPCLPLSLCQFACSVLSWVSVPFSPLSPVSLVFLPVITAIPWFVLLCSFVFLYSFALPAPSV